MRWTPRHGVGNGHPASTRCQNCGATFPGGVEEITIGEFTQKMLVLVLGFGICSLLAYLMINVNHSNVSQIIRNHVINSIRTMCPTKIFKMILVKCTCKSHWHCLMRIVRNMLLVQNKNKQLFTRTDTVCSRLHWQARHRRVAPPSPHRNRRLLRVALGQLGFV